MGACLSHCFRSTNEQSTIDSVSQPSRVNFRRGHESKNRLSTLFLSQERVASSPSGLDSIHINNSPKDETQFLKACGTTLATSIEIRKVSEKLETPKRGKRFGSSHFHASVFHLDEKIDELFKEVSEQTPSSCLTDARNSAGEESQESIGTAFRDAVDRIEKVPLAAGNINGKTKSLQFETDFDQSYSSTSSKNITSRKSELAGKTCILTTLPNQTSMKLSNEIQTPETIFPANMESAARGRPRIRSQFVHSASVLTENFSLCKLFEDSNEGQKQTKLQACDEKTETESTTSVAFGEKLEETSFSPRVKQKSNTNMAALSNITHGDRPIIGMVAAHWNEKEQSQISSKWWDGNGIPNSTNKYKEDQKVSWHSTSFEERLEKALSSESGQSFIPAKEFGIMEETERDTAISKLQHSAQSKSVVSF